MILRRSFSLDRDSASASREFVRGAVSDLPGVVQESLVLMTSELATNALVHAGSGFEVTIDRTPVRVRIEVTDEGAGDPQVQSPASHEPHGRGLRIVDTLADEWGILERPGRAGKTMWCVVGVDRSTPSGGGELTTDRARRRSASPPRSPTLRSASAPHDAPHDGQDRSERTSR
jgi:anti-sigma regulatory factor (Ser/Thr protein kinase)